MDDINLKELVINCINGDINKVIGSKNLEKYINSSYYLNYGEEYTPLFGSINNTFKEESKILLEFLLKNGANPNYACQTGGSFMYPVHKIILEDLESLETGALLTDNGLKLLIKYGAEINLKNGQGRTPLDLATLYGHYPAEDLLKGLGANNSDAFFREDNIHHLRKINDSVVTNNFKKVKFFLERGLDVNHLTDIGFVGLLGYATFASPIHLAISPNKKMFYGDDLKMVELLISYGANINIIDGNNKTPLDLALKYEKYEIINLLKELGAKLFEEIDETEKLINKKNFEANKIITFKEKTSKINNSIEYFDAEEIPPF